MPIGFCVPKHVESEHGNLLLSRRMAGVANSLEEIVFAN
jgi:hypothetical protein